MKALTILQPWASLVILGEKRFETRGWTTNHRGPLAIHAGKDVMYAAESFFDNWPYVKETLAGHETTAWRQLPFGAVLGIVEIVDVLPSWVASEVAGTRERSFGDFSHGRYAWKLKVLERFADPIPARGLQGLWSWDERVRT